MSRRIVCFLSVLLAAQLSCVAQSDILTRGVSLGDIFKKEKKYVPGQPFPKKGYKLDAVTYHNIELHKFVESDTLYYLKYSRTANSQDFYFCILGPEAVDTILDHSLNSERTSKKLDRKLWLRDALDSMQINNMSAKNPYWTYFKPKKHYQRNGYSTLQKFDLSAAVEAYNEQRNAKAKISGMEILGMLYFANLFFGGNQHAQYRCRTCGKPFSNAADLRSHENAYHDY